MIHWTSQGQTVCLFSMMGTAANHNSCLLDLSLTQTHKHIPPVPLRFVYSKYLVASLAPTMLTITNDQPMGDLELLSTQNQLSDTVPAGQGFVLTSVSASMLQNLSISTTCRSLKAAGGFACLSLCVYIFCIFIS